MRGEYELARTPGQRRQPRQKEGHILAAEGLEYSSTSGELKVISAQVKHRNKARTDPVSHDLIWKNRSQVLSQGLLGSDRHFGELAQGWCREGHTVERPLRGKTGSLEERWWGLH